MNFQPKVSIITVVYNGIAHLEETIESVLGQSYENIEYIIIDGGSTDGTVELIEKYDEQITYWGSEPDGGIYDAMNKGIAKATGEIVGLINADDWYAKDAVANAVEAFRTSSADVVHGAMEIVSEDGSSFVKDAEMKLDRLAKGMLINHPTLFAKRDLYEKYGGFDTSYKIVADWELMVRWWQEGAKFVAVDDCLAHFRMGGVSSEHLKRSFKEKHRVRKGAGLYQRWDAYYLYDRLKSVLPGSTLLKISLLRQKKIGV